MNNLPEVKLKPSRHNNHEVIQIHFKKNDEVHQLLRSATQMRWSKTMNCWYVPFSKTIAQDLFQLLKNKAYLDYTDLKANPITESSISIKPQIRPVHELKALSLESRKKIEEFKHWLSSKRYSESTIGTYVDALTTFLRYFSNKPISEITNNDIILFNNYYILANKFSASFQNQVVNAIKLFFSKIENKKLNPELIHRPKRPKLLPNVLSKEEVKAILEAPLNLKHRTMLGLIYACGLRRSELLNLRLTDLDKQRNLLIIRQSKGRKDRITPLPLKALDMIQSYLEAYKPSYWLFEGQDKKSRYEPSSLANVLKQSLEKVGIKKLVTLHWLRHSYATHLLENGTDLRYIQELLGHNSSRTTEIYTHVSNKNIQKIVSPYDVL